MVQVQSKHSLLLSNGREISAYKVAYASAKTVLCTQVWVKFRGRRPVTWHGWEGIREVVGLEGSVSENSDFKQTLITRQHAEVEIGKD